MAELPETMKPIMVMALHTGLRLSNIVMMKWEWVDLSHKSISIPAKMHKNRKLHVVMMNKAVFSLLVSLKKQRNVIELNSEGCIFLHEHEEPYTKDSAGRAFRSACFRAGVKVRFHDLRHTFATLLARKGASPFDLRDAMGHSDTRQTSQYVHPIEERMREVVGLLD